MTAKTIEQLCLQIMSQINVEPDKVHWSRKQGNKYNKSLHPAMLTEAGFVTTAKIALLDEPRTKHRYVTIVYDRLYVIYWLKTKIIKPLQNIGVGGVIQLIKEAWQLTHQSENDLASLELKTHD